MNAWERDEEGKREGTEDILTTASCWHPHILCFFHEVVCSCEISLYSYRGFVHVVGPEQCKKGSSEYTADLPGGDSSGESSPDSSAGES